MQSVEKSTFQYVRMTFCPENVGNRSSSPQNESELSPRSMQSCCPLAQGPSCRRIFSVQLGQLRLQSSIGSTKTFFFGVQSGIVIVFHPVGSKKCQTVISCNWAPREAGNSSGEVLQKAPTHFEARKTNFQHFRAKAHANVLNGTRFQRTANPTA